MTKMKISEFSKLTGISRDNLIFYDKQKLLIPELRGENGYRYYTEKQLSQAYMIFILRRLEIPINEIKQYCEQQSDQILVNLFKNKRNDINKRIKELETARDVMNLYTNNLKSAQTTNLNTVQLKKINRKNLFLGPILSKNESQNFELANLNFYKYCNSKGINLMFPFGIIFDKKYLVMNQNCPIKQCYFQVSKDYNSFQPSGTYAVIQALGIDKNIDQLKNTLFEYIKKNDLTITSDIYVDYPRNEVTNSNPSEFLTRVMIKIS